MPHIYFGDRGVGDGFACYVVGEIGINHNGNVEIAKQLIDLAAQAGCDAVKFQKRVPELCVPDHQKNLMRETPWGAMTYLEYRNRIELGRAEYDEIDAHCRERGIQWFASCWDPQSVDFIETYHPPCHKIASASLTDTALLERILATGRPVMLSTGMSTLEEVDRAVARFPRERLAVLHAVSTYPAQHSELNLNVIRTFKERYGVPIGYSGHETGIATSVSACAIGACIIERHITIDRAMWGSDQAASLGPSGLARLMRDIRMTEEAMGDGIKRLLDSELPSRKRLRGDVASS